MKLTDEELEILDTLICDANEVEFEEFTNNLSVFAIHCKDYEQEWIADHVTELFTDKFFVYAVKKYADVKEHSRVYIMELYKNKSKSCIEETASNWYKTTSQIYEQLIYDYLFTSGRV